MLAFILRTAHFEMNYGKAPKAAVLCVYSAQKPKGRSGTVSRVPALTQLDASPIPAFSGDWGTCLSASAGFSCLIFALTSLFHCLALTSLFHCLPLIRRGSAVGEEERWSRTSTSRPSTTISELLPVLPRKDKTPCPLPGHRKPLCRRNAHSNCFILEGID